MITCIQFSSVAMRASIKAATRITSLYSFVSTITGVLFGLLIVPWVRRLKPFIIFGWIVAGLPQWLFFIHIEVQMMVLNQRSTLMVLLEVYVSWVLVLDYSHIQHKFRFKHVPITNTWLLLSHCTWRSIILDQHLGVVLAEPFGLTLCTSIFWISFKKLGLIQSLAGSAYGNPFTFITLYAWGYTTTDCNCFSICPNPKTFMFNWFSFNFYLTLSNIIVERPQIRKCSIIRVSS